MHRVGYLPFEVGERVILEPSFATSELVLAAKRSPRYRVLSVTEKSVHLYEGTREGLSEVHNDRFPKPAHRKAWKPNWKTISASN